MVSFRDRIYSTRLGLGKDHVLGLEQVHLV